MKKSLITLFGATVLLWSCTQQTNNEKADMNPFLTAYQTKFNVPPFEKIKTEHFKTALEAGVEQQRAEIDEIVNKSDAPTFENTIEALDASGKLLSEVNNVFENLQSANTSDELQKVAKETSSMLSKHQDDMLLNEKLFNRIKAVYDQRETLNLDQEQKMLLEKTYKRFSRNGANLNDADKEKLRRINEKLAILALEFDENILAETNAFQLVIEDAGDLAGLPQTVIDGAANAATEVGLSGKWVFTVHKPSMIPFLQYSEKRELREKIFNAYINRGNNNNKNDNKLIAAREASLRAERAQLLGYETHAGYVLEENMARSPKNVYSFLDEVKEPAMKMAEQEAIELQKLIDREGGAFSLKPWDWWFYAEKLKKQQYDLDEALLRPYFKLENVQHGMFEVANKLYGLQFNQLTDVPVYHPEVETFEVLEASGSHVGILYMDFYPRASKGGGAWMTSFRKQSKKEGVNVPPVISMVMNFSKPTADKPALLSYDEVLTMFHEFGHALHGLLSDCNYTTLSGTSVPRDFVELPSQIMENWAADPEVLKMYAKHFKTGEPIPQALIEKIRNSSKFNQGFATIEYLAACYLDMDWHTLTDTTQQNTIEFENASMQRIGLIPQIVVRYRSPYFSHIFAGGYSSGYYSYLWAEILDADAFEAFKETSLYDKETARMFRENILSRGGTENPVEMYKKFRGREPEKEAMLKRKGLI